MCHLSQYVTARYVKSKNAQVVQSIDHHAKNVNSDIINCPKICDNGIYVMLCFFSLIRHILANISLMHLWHTVLH